MSSTTSSAPTGAATVSTTVTPYDGFINLPQGLADVYGPWRARIISQDISPAAIHTFSTSKNDRLRMVATSPLSAGHQFLLVQVYFEANITVNSSEFVIDNNLLFYSFNFTAFFSDFGYDTLNTTDPHVYIVAGVSGVYSENSIKISNYTEILGDPEEGSRKNIESSIPTSQLREDQNMISLLFQLGYPSHGGFQFYVEDVQFRITNARVSDSSGSPSSSPSSPTTLSSSSSSSTLPAGAIAGIVVAVVVVALLGLAFALRRRRQKQRDEEERQRQKRDAAEKQSHPPKGDVTETTIFSAAASSPASDPTATPTQPILGQDSTSPRSEISAPKSPGPETSESGPWYKNKPRASLYDEDVTSMTRLDEE